MMCITLIIEYADDWPRIRITTNECCRQGDYGVGVGLGEGPPANLFGLVRAPVSGLNRRTARASFF
jgi:hypothetical protein